MAEYEKESSGKWGAVNDKKPYKKSSSKLAKDANKPKRPGTAFMLFMADFRKEMAGKEPEGGVVAMARLGGERWRGMTDEEKKPYVEQQLEAKLQYEHSMEEYNSKAKSKSLDQS